MTGVPLATPVDAVVDGVDVEGAALGEEVLLELEELVLELEPHAATTTQTATSVKSAPALLARTTVLLNLISLLRSCIPPAADAVSETPAYHGRSWPRP